MKKKYHDHGYVEMTSLAMAKEWVVEDMKEFIEPCSMLTLDQALSGETHFGQLPPFPLDTSPGLPWMALKKTQQKGKTEWFEQDEEGWKPMPEVVERVNEMLANHEEKLANPIVFRGTLKDERRDVERVSLKKTRIFTAAPMEKTLVDRMYFGDMIYQFKNNRVEMNHAYGINAEGTEWNDMIHKHLDVGRNHFGFDYSGFDASEHPILTATAMDIVKEFYPKEMHDRIECSGVECFNHFVVMGRNLYHAHQGNPSGIFLTTFVNTLVNWIVLYIAYIRLAIETGNHSFLSRTMFHRNVALHCYGDDFICTVSDAARWFNGTSIPPILQEIGITATAPDKGECQSFIPLNELTFLTRSFLPNPFEGPKHLFVGPLSKQLIEEIPRWCWSGANDEDYKGTLTAAIRSAALHGDSYFGWFCDELRKSDTCRRLMGEIGIRDQFLNVSSPFVGGVRQDIEDPMFFFSGNENRFLSNFYECKIQWKGFTFKCSEAIYVFEKYSECELPGQGIRVVRMNGPAAKRFSGVLNRQMTESQKQRWDKVKVSVMKKILQRKFEQNPDLKERLVSTGNRPLVESTPDKFWGAGLAEKTLRCHLPNDYPGTNHLGRLLVDLRNSFSFKTC
jgi:ribA/ribD-fused uncharacterized protein